MENFRECKVQKFDLTAYCVAFWDIEIEAQWQLKPLPQRAPHLLGTVSKNYKVILSVHDYS